MLQWLKIYVIKNLTLVNGFNLKIIVIVYNIHVNQENHKFNNVSQF